MSFRKVLLLFKCGRSQVRSLKIAPQQQFPGPSPPLQISETKILFPRSLQPQSLQIIITRPYQVINGSTCSKHQSYHFSAIPVPPSCTLRDPLSISSRILANRPHGIAVTKRWSVSISQRRETSSDAYHSFPTSQPSRLARDHRRAPNTLR